RALDVPVHHARPEPPRSAKLAAPHRLLPEGRGRVEDRSRALLGPVRPAHEQGAAHTRPRLMWGNSKFETRNPKGRQARPRLVFLSDFALRISNFPAPPGETSVRERG